jgi:hypothetical protein
MLLLLAAAIVAAAIVFAAQQIVGELRRTREDAARSRALTVAQMFAPGIAAAQADPRALLVWQPLAKATRQLFPVEFSTLDAMTGGAFPFTTGQVQAAHSQWTADWLAWERSHDYEYKLKAAAAEHELAASGGSPILQARLEAVEREKLDLYQHRYQDYVRVAKALQALVSSL